MSRISENETFLIMLANSPNKNERVKLLKSANESQLLSVFEIVYNFTHNPNVHQLISDKKKNKNILNKLKSFKFPKSKRELKLDRIRKLLIKFNSVLPGLVSIFLVNLIGFIRDNCV